MNLSGKIAGVTLPSGHRLVLGNDGLWTSPDSPSIASFLNQVTKYSPRLGAEPSQGRYGQMQARQVAEDYQGVLEFQDVASPTEEGTVY